jgi:hypothetical protein
MSGEPVDKVPKQRRPGGAKYGPIYQEIDALDAGEWLPVRFDTKAEAFNFREACVKHRTRNMEAKQRGTTVYARNKQE